MDELATMPCHFCGAPSGGEWSEVRGWTHRRSAGGANQITQRRETGRWACKLCGRDLQAGRVPGAPKLFQ